MRAVVGVWEGAPSLGKWGVTNTPHPERCPMELYRHLMPFIKEIAPSWRKTQLVNLTLLCQALLCRHSLTLTELARAYPVPDVRRVKSPRHGLLHRVKRLWRFLANPRLGTEEMMRNLTVLSYSVCQSPGMLLPVLVDLTYFRSFAVLSANVPRGGRALPIAWRCFRRDLAGVAELSQNLLVQRVIREMLARMARGIQAVIVADREFASAALFRFLKAQGSSFAIRVDAETHVLHRRYSGALGDIGIRCGGRRIWLEGALYSKEGRERVNILAVWETKQREPWFIASDLSDPRLVERMYRKRMKIEHGYRDWKHHLRLKGTPRVKSAEQLSGLLLGVVALYWYLCLLGVRASHSNLVRELASWGELGLFKLGMELARLGEQFLAPSSTKLCRWVHDKLSYLRPIPPAYKLRYLQHRVVVP